MNGLIQPQPCYIMSLPVPVLERVIVDYLTSKDAKRLTATCWQIARDLLLSSVWGRSCARLLKGSLDHFRLPIAQLNLNSRETARAWRRLYELREDHREPWRATALDGHPH